MSAANADLTSERIEGIARHGMRNFNVPLISHIAGNLYVGGCIDGVPLPDGIEHVVSLYTGQQYRMHEGLRSWLIVPNMGDVAEQPDESFVWTLAAHVDRCAAIGPTLVHCQAGLNRSNLIAGAALILHGHTPDAAIRLLRERRCDAVLCNETFETWLRERGGDARTRRTERLGTLGRKAS
jgi:protein-tyrosine phosphatase